MTNRSIRPTATLTAAACLVVGLACGSTIAAAPLPAPRAAASSAADHKLYGTVASFGGGFLVLRLRSGRLLRVEDRQARSAVLLRRGRPIIVFGKFDGGGTLHARSIWRTFPDMAHWPPDR